MNQLIDNTAVNIIAHDFERRIEHFINNCNDKQTVANRKDALNNFKKTGLPHIRLEDWKYTDLQHLGRLGFAFNESVLDAQYSEKLISNIKNYVKDVLDKTLDFSCVVFLDGIYNKDLSIINTDVSGNYIGSRRQCIQDLSWVDNYKVNQDHPINNLINATWQDGVALVCYALGDKKHHIKILNIFTKFGSNNFINVKNICLVGKQQELEIIEEYLCFDIKDDLIHNPLLITEQIADFSSNTSFDIVLEDDARCHHYLLQNQPHNIYQVSIYNIIQYKNSEYYNYNINFGAKLSRQDIVVNQQQERSSCNLYGLFLPKAKQHMDSHLKVMHNSSHGKSVQNYLGVLSGRGHGVFNGMVYVEKDTMNNHATQSNKNILLSEYAQIDTKPELQIHTDDVICSHGATIGRLDENAMFYLQSRGINKIEAKNLLIAAFINNILLFIKNGQVLKWLETNLNLELSYITEKL